MALPAPVQKQETPFTKPDHSELGTVGVSLAVQPQAWPLASAASLLNGYRQHDLRSPDLGDIISSERIECHCTPDLFQSKVYSPFVVSQRSVPFLMLQVLNGGSKQGVIDIGERGTVWASNTETTLFWDLHTGDVKDFGLAKVDNIITAAPNHDVFATSVKQILVVSCNEELVLYALGDKNEIYSTNMSISTAQLGHVKLISTEFGRIFFFCEFTGPNLFEFRYQAKDSWLRKKTERVCHGEYGGLLGGLFGASVDKSKNAERVRDVQLDNSSCRLYVLTTKSNLHVYHFEPRGKLVTLEDNFSRDRIFRGLRFPRLVSHNEKVGATDQNGARRPGSGSNIMSVNAGTSGATSSATGSLSSTSTDSTGSTVGSTVGSGTFGGIPVPLEAKNLVSISPVLSKDSHKIALIGITSTGARVYFKTDLSKLNRRLVPCVVQYPAIPEGHETSKIQATTSSRVMDGQISHVVSGKKVLSAVIDKARVTLQHDTGQQISFVELSGWFSIDNDALLITRKGDQDYLLTRTSLYAIRNRPFSERFVYGDIPYALVQVYGTMQVCCGALAVAISTTNRAARENAIASFFRFGGLPMFKDKVSTGFLGHVSIRLSALFDGLALLLARLVEPIWDKTILDSKDQPPPLKLLNKVHSELTGLVRFLDQNRSFSEGMSDRGGYNNTDDAAMLSQAEYKGLQAMGRLARSSQEGVAFLRLVLNHHNSKDVLSYFDSNKMHVFRQLKFGTFFTAAKESDISKELVNSLISHVLNNGDSVDSVASVIQDLCPSYCSAGDVLEYKALEYIHHAKKQRDPDMSSLARSVGLIRKAASSIQIDTLEDVVKDYVQLKYYSGAIQAALAVAAEQDPANLAITFLRQNDAINEPSVKRRQIATSTINGAANSTVNSTVTHAIPGTNDHLSVTHISESELKYKAKNAVYDLIFRYVLTPNAQLADAPMNDPVKVAMLESSDEVWHFALYNWFLETNRQDQIALLDTPFVANYLQLGANKDLRIANLLWKWYQRRGDVLAAADVLLDLARGPLAENLGQRVEFLSRAMGYCQAQVQPTQQAINMTTMVRAYLGLALLQTDIQKVVKDPRLDRQIYTVSELYNDFAEARGLYDLCLATLEFADYRDPVVIKQCWEKLLTKTRAEDANENTSHYAHVTSIISQLGAKYNLVESIFSPKELVPFFEEYSVTYIPNAPHGWLVDAFELAGIDLHALDQLYTKILQNGVLLEPASEHARGSQEYLQEKLRSSV